MNKAQAYELACELEAARFIRKLREREARARFTDAPVLTGFDQLPEPVFADNTKQALRGHDISDVRAALGYRA